MKNIDTIIDEILSKAINHPMDLKNVRTYRNKIASMLEGFPKEDEISGLKIEEKDGIITICYFLLNPKGQKNKIIVNYSSEKEFKIIYDYNYESVHERTILEQKIIKVPGEMFEFHENEIEMDTEKCERYTHNKSERAVRERYDSKTGISLKRQTMTFWPEKVSSSIGTLTVGDHLTWTRNYGNFNSKASTMHTLELTRISHDLMRINSTGKNNLHEDITYVGYTTLGTEDYVTLPNYSGFLMTGYDYLPGVNTRIPTKSESEIKKEIYYSRFIENEEQRKFLLELAKKNNRADFSFDTTKSKGSR